MSRDRPNPQTDVPPPCHHKAPLEEVHAEMHRQTARWGAPGTRSHTPWLQILVEEVGEAARAQLEESDDRLREELVQIAAVAAAWIEAHDAKQKEPPAI